VQRERNATRNKHLWQHHLNRELHALNKGQIASAIRHKILIIEKSGDKLFRLL